MKTLKLILVALLIFPISIIAQENVKKTLIDNNFSEHEFGISWGAFPTSGVLVGVNFGIPASTVANGRYSILHGLSFPWFAHRESSEWDGPTLFDEESGEYYKEKESYTMQHYGSLTANYQYHIKKKHSIGGTFSWLGRYITNYTRNQETGEIIDAKGWDNSFSLCANYRFTYYNKNAVSLYTALHLGITIVQIEKKLLLASEKSAYCMAALQVTGLGIEAGKTHAFIAELGFGCQGLLKVGYRYKFKNH